MVGFPRSGHIFLYALQVSTTLVSMNDEDTLEKNLQAALNPLGSREVKVRDYIMQHYFLPLKVKHWEGVEITAYKNKMQKSFL